MDNPENQEWTIQRIKNGQSRESGKHWAQDIERRP